MWTTSWLYFDYKKINKTFKNFDLPKIYVFVRDLVSHKEYVSVWLRQSETRRGCVRTQYCLIVWSSLLQYFCLTPIISSQVLVSSLLKREKIRGFIVRQSYSLCMTMLILQAVRKLKATVSSPIFYSLFTSGINLLYLERCKITSASESFVELN